MRESKEKQANISLAKYNVTQTLLACRTFKAKIKVIIYDIYCIGLHKFSLLWKQIKVLLSDLRKLRNYTMTYAITVRLAVPYIHTYIHTYIVGHDCGNSVSINALLPCEYR
jgi:hypothetical protein